MFHKISLIIVASFLTIIGYYSIGQPFAGNASSDIVVNAIIEAGISITAAASPVSLLPAMNGFTGGAATAALAWNIKTNNAGGYSVSINKNHPLQIGDTPGADEQFTDYSAASADPTYNWIAPAAGDAELGFAINSLTSGVTADANFLNNGSDTCNTSTTFTSLKCWDVVPTTAGSITIASRGAPTDYAGDDIAIQLKAQVVAPGAGDTYLQAGAYTTTVSATASML